jgi:hypothetical protein
MYLPSLLEDPRGFGVYPRHNAVRRVRESGRQLGGTWNDKQLRFTSWSFGTYIPSDSEFPWAFPISFRVMTSSRLESPTLN